MTGISNNERSKWIGILYVALLVSTLSGVLSKVASTCPVLSFEFVFYYGSMIVCIAVYAFIWQMVIKHLPLSLAYANKASTVLLTIIAGAIFFKETITIKQIIGAIVIILGILLYVKSEEKDEG